MDGNSVNYEDIRKEYRELNKGIKKRARKRKEYRELNKGIKKRARKDKRIWADNLARRAEEAAASHNTREVYRNTRLLARRSSGIAQYKRSLQKHQTASEERISE
ncbi:hypothetical protein QE152_g11236 [Popillia japonica]|uniref:Uncharacterized protein n=1 Tax=Popillia japonica TaxID=7064 RepID=A0AAW1LSX3_POPJA